MSGCQQYRLTNLCPNILTNFVKMTEKGRLEKDERPCILYVSMASTV